MLPVKSAAYYYSGPDTFALMKWKKRGPDKVFSCVVITNKVSPLQNLGVVFDKLLEFNS